MEAIYSIPVPEFYREYVNETGTRNFMDVLRESSERITHLLASLPESKWQYSYAPGKWTVAELLLHLSDCERVFAYRTLRFSRNDKTALPGFDENDCAANSNAKARSGASLLSEYKAVRNATLEMFSNFSPEMLNRSGTANGNKFTVAMLGAIIAGHELHHLGVLKDRYQIL